MYMFYLVSKEKAVGYMMLNNNFSIIFCFQSEVRGCISTGESELPPLTLTRSPAPSTWMSLLR